MVDIVVANAPTNPPAAPVKARRQKKSAATAAAPAAAAVPTPAPVAVAVSNAVTNGHVNGTASVSSDAATPVSVDEFRNALKSLLDQQDAIKVQVRNLLRLHKVAVQQAVDAAVAAASSKRSSRRAAKSDRPARHVVAAMYEMRPEFASFLMTLDPSRERVTDRSLISRPQATKSLWMYIKSHDLQKKFADRSRIQVDSTLANLLHLESDFVLTNKSIQNVLARLFYPRAPKSAPAAVPAATTA